MRGGCAAAWSNVVPLISPRDVGSCTSSATAFNTVWRTGTSSHARLYHLKRFARLGQSARRSVLPGPVRLLQRRPCGLAHLLLGGLRPLVLCRLQARSARCSATSGSAGRSCTWRRREQLGLPEPKPHTAAFDQTEKYSLLNLEPPAHTRLRTLVNRAFVSRNVEQLRPRIERLANELIDGFAADGEVELLKAYAAPIPAIVIAEMIGLPADMATQLVSWSNRMVTMYMFGVTRETELDANQASAEFMDYLGGVIAERRRQAARGPAHPHDHRRGRRPKAQRRRDHVDHHPAAQCRPRGDRPHDRQRRQGDPRKRHRSRTRCSPTRRRPRPRSRNACASTRRCICSRAMRWRISSSRAATASSSATRSG